MRAPRLVRAAAAAALLLVAGACARDDSAAADAASTADGAALPAPAGDGAAEVRVTPAESAAAARRVRSYADSVQREAQRRAGIEPDEEAPPPPPAPEPSAQAEFEGCMAQARVAEGHTRTLIEQGCERRRQTRAAEGG